MPASPMRSLILGGARSGKSQYALQLAKRRWQHPLYLATAEERDDEMRRRVAEHRRARDATWLCVEEPLAIATVLRDTTHQADGILVDCLTLWLANVLLKEGIAAVEQRQEELLAAVQVCPRHLIFISNEVGMGIVPEHDLGRSFRDLAGRLHQNLAAAMDSVVLMIAGLPWALKGALPE